MISPMSTGHITKEAQKMMIGLFIYLTPGGHQFKNFLMCSLLIFSLIREQRDEYVYIILLHLHLHLLFHCCYQWLIHSYVAQLTIVNFSHVHAGEQDSCYMQTLHTITQTDMPKPVLFAAADTSTSLSSSSCVIFLALLLMCLY